MFERIYPTMFDPKISFARPLPPVSLRLQETLLRPFTAVAAIEAPAASRSADQRLVDLAHESECLKATIARQQEQINALLKQKEPLKAGKVPEDPEEEARNENWTCHDCTFQNIQELQECEMCGAARFQSQPSKKPRRAAPAVIDVPLEASPVAVRDLSDGPREFLRQATQVVEANVTSGSQHASQEDRKADESEICEDTCLDWIASCAFDLSGVRYTAGKMCHFILYLSSPCMHSIHSMGWRRWPSYDPLWVSTTLAWTATIF